MIDECIQQRITVISTTDRQLIELNNYKLRERAKAIAHNQRLDKARMERWQMWLKWTFGTLHRASNRTTFYYLVWTPLVIFYCAIAFMGMPTAVVCPKPKGVCHNLRVLAVETRLMPQVLWAKVDKEVAMEIFAFLLGLGCLVLIVWAIAFVGSLISGWKYRRRRRLQRRSLSAPPEIRQQRASDKSPLVAVQPRKAIDLVCSSVSTRVRLPSYKHQQYIRQADIVLEQLRSGEVQLPKALGILRKMNPYAFEELLLTCCHERGWKIERNFKYSNDGGIDGRVTIAGKLYLIQAKRYRGYIKAKDIQDFDQVLQREKVHGGFFIHTGRTGEKSKELLREYQVSLLSGQKLVDFVLGQRLKILGRLNN